jgi:hypothetical protein
VSEGRRILASPAYREIMLYAMYAHELGLDVNDPDIIERYIRAGEAAHAREVERTSVEGRARELSKPPQRGEHEPVV